MSESRPAWMQDMDEEVELKKKKLKKPIPEEPATQEKTNPREELKAIIEQRTRAVKAQEADEIRPKKKMRKATGFGLDGFQD